MATAEKKFGITAPISTALPTESENRANTALLEELRKQKTFESPSDTEKRYKVLESLQQICDEFVKRVARKKEPNNETLVKDARGKIFTYGSFRLGVYGPGSDIDTLVVAPKYVTRDDYFEVFPGLLEEMTPKGAVTDLAVVTDAFVPIIKFEYLGISIDLIFSRIAMLKQLPKEKEWDLKDSNLLRGLDEKELRSLNGTRVTDEILDLVPEPATFKLALRAIKLWANRRAIYANIMGFPGGVAWAMLVARVCQLYPKATSSTVVNKFFHIMRQWPWPQPVLLKRVESGPLQVRVWNPQVYKSDTFHLMPIITPAYPSMCATYNITNSSMSVIQRELERGAEISDLVMTGKRPWSDLFIKHNFFTSDYKYYLAVVSASLTKEAHKIWSGFVESKVRVLVQNLERHESIALAHPYTKGYERVHRCKDDGEVDKVQQGFLDFVTSGASSDTSDAQPPAGEEPSESTTTVYTTTHYIGLQLNEGSRSIDLAYAVAQFKELCTEWEKYDAQLNSISIQHVKNTNLPDDVFEAGESKPQRPVKRRANGVAKANPGSANGTGNPAATNRKRGAPEQQDSNASKRQATSVVAAG